MRLTPTRCQAALATGLLLAFGPSATAAEPEYLAPEQLGEIFCIARLANDMQAASGLLSPDLQQAIAEAEAADAAWADRHPGDKPPLGDGIPWASFPDHPDSCTLGEPLWQMDEAQLKVSYGFAGAPDAAFTDTLSLVLVENPAAPNTWRIDNVVYAADGDLRTVLLSAFMD